MNRPEKPNAMNSQMHYEMDRALPDIEADPEVRAVVLTGAGEAYCAGQDLKEYFRGLDDNPVERRRAVRRANVGATGVLRRSTSRLSPWSTDIASAAASPRR